MGEGVIQAKQQNAFKSPKTQRKTRHAAEISRKGSVPALFPMATCKSDEKSCRDNHGGRACCSYRGGLDALRKLKKVKSLN
jgi:hypothetical protein